jgi:hypothetical protein
MNLCTTSLSTHSIRILHRLSFSFAIHHELEAETCLAALPIIISANATCSFLDLFFTGVVEGSSVD